MAIYIPHINAIDPSRTLTLRNNWVKDFRRRYRMLTSAITDAIVTQDVLGLVNDVQTINKRINITNASGLTPRQFDFERDADKIAAFMDWIEEQTALYIMSGGTQGIQFMEDINQISSENNWMNTYIDSAYQQGIRRGRQELKKAGVDVGDIPTGLTNDPIQAAFNTPLHVNRVGLVYTRSFSTLKAINSSMDSTISDVLAIGMAEGRGPMQIASAINKAISGKGDDFGIFDSLGRFIPAQRRAEILARTEVIRAHHSANIGEYKAAGILGIKVQVEHLTAGDDRVCPKCEPLNGNIYTIEEAENIIPVHPQCRCVALPYLEDNIQETPSNTRRETQQQLPILYEEQGQSFSRNKIKQWKSTPVPTNHINATDIDNIRKNDLIDLISELDPPEKRKDNIKLSLLKTYQSTVNKDKVERIAENFSNSLYKKEGLPTVFKLPDGTLLLKDGNHRVNAAKLLNKEELEFNINDFSE